MQKHESNFQRPVFKSAFLFSNVIDIAVLPAQRHLVGNSWEAYKDLLLKCFLSLYCAVTQRSQQNLDDIFTLIIDKMYICIHVLIRHGGQLNFLYRKQSIAIGGVK